MVKSGLIIGAIALVLALGATLLSPFCVPCLAILLGLVAGYLSGVFDRPAGMNPALKSGAAGGAIGGAGALLGQLIGSALNATLVGPQGAHNLIPQLGLPTTGNFETSYWIGMVFMFLCIGGISVGLSAGMGLVGSLLWWQFSGNK